MSTDISWTCKWGFYHDREVVFNEPASNNGFIYSAFAFALNLPVDRHKIQETAQECLDSDGFWIIRRRPDKPLPPFSRDELIGLFFLNIPMSNIILRVASNGWTWLNHREIYQIYSLWDAIKVFWRARNKHRNYIWREEELPAYPYMFKVTPADRFYFKTRLGFKTTLWEKMAWTAYKYFTNWRGSASEKNILWLQLFDLKDKYIKKIDREKNFLDYFGESHVFNLGEID